MEYSHIPNSDATMHNNIEHDKRKISCALIKKVLFQYGHSGSPRCMQKIGSKTNDMVKLENNFTKTTKILLQFCEIADKRLSKK